MLLPVGVSAVEDWLLDSIDVQALIDKSRTLSGTYGLGIVARSELI